MRFGRYEVICKLAEGGMAEVFLAELAGPGGFQKRFAIKRLLPALSGDAELVQLLLDEAKTASLLTHPNICQLFELGVDEEGRHFLVMEFLEGASLTQIMRQKPAWAPLARAVAKVARGLAYAHTRADEAGRPLGIVHRDVSLDNLMVTVDGQVKVLDFGIAHAAHRSVKTKAGLVRGKVAYMSPEQIRTQPLDGRTDVYALGVVLWELLAGRRMFAGQSDVQTMYAALAGERPLPPADRGVPEAMWSIAASALELDRERRWPSAALMADALERALDAADAGTEAEHAATLAILAKSAREAAGALAPPPPTRPVDAPIDIAIPEPRPEPEARPKTRTAEAPRPKTRTALAMPVEEETPPGAPETERRRGSLGAAVAFAAALASLGAAAWLRLTREEAVQAPTPRLAEVQPVPAEVQPSQEIAAPTPTAMPQPTPAPTPTPIERPASPRPDRRRAHPTPAAAKIASSTPAPATGTGRLVLDTVPWTKVYVEGRFLGDTPLNEVAVPAGHLRLRAVNVELGIDKLIEVDVAADQLVRLRREW
ncbi:MAG: protein kinase [Myxococcota bacterium]